MIEKFTLDRILAGVLGCLLCIQIFLLLFYNLRDTRTLINADAASAIYHFMEVIDNGTLNLPDWNIRLHWSWIPHFCLQCRFIM